MGMRVENGLVALRIGVEGAAAFFLTSALLNYGVLCSRIGNWFAQLQFVPAVMALSLSVLAFWIAVSLVFGRIYCSTVCPAGALMDLFSRTRPRHKVYRHSREWRTLRLVCFGVFAILLMLPLPVVSRWLEPYGFYAGLVESVTSGRVCFAAFVSVAALGTVAAVSYRRGRLLCNTLCPVGTLLGSVSRRSAFHIDINTDRCTQCRRCVDVCKSECIDLNDHVADMSRCVVCFNCLTVCPDDAIRYTLDRHKLSTPLMQKIPTLKDKQPTTSLACNNTSTSCKTSSTTESEKPTGPAPER